MIEAVVLGMGSIGKRHVANLKKLGVRVRDVYDPFVSGLGGSLLPDMRGRAVVIASPTRHHATQLRQALEAGAAGVYVEKPTATSEMELARALLGLDLSGVKVATGYNWRFSPLADQLRGARDAHGEYRLLTYVGSNDVSNWPGYGPGYYALDPVGGGALLTSMSHAVDLVLHIMGEASFVNAACLERDGVDVGWSIQIFFSKDRLVTLSFMWTDRQPTLNQWFGVMQDHNMLVTSGDADLWPPGTDMHLDCMRQFVEWVGGGDAGMLCTLRQSMEVMHVLDVIRSVATGTLTLEQLRGLRGGE